MTYRIATFYRFVPLPDCAAWQPLLQARCDRAGLRGTLLLAAEGINGTVAGRPEAIAALLAELRSRPELADLTARESAAETQPFRRMKVRLKREIVTLGQPDLDPARAAGIPVAPEDWNALLADPATIAIDARNDFEVAVGSFQGAIDPQTRTFREFPEFVRRHLDRDRHTQIALFCTGGIRCEKASAYLRQQGFAPPYQLQGGILQYLDRVPEAESRWRGECFVFDDRVTVGHGLQPGRSRLCRACGRAVVPVAAAGAETRCPRCGTPLPENCEGNG